MEEEGEGDSGDCTDGRRRQPAGVIPVLVRGDCLRRLRYAHLAIFMGVAVELGKRAFEAGTSAARRQ
jgi:hypothetical protein